MLGDMSAAPRPSSPIRPLMLTSAVRAFVTELPDTRTAQAEATLMALDKYLGGTSPLLAYTRLTGEAWVRTLPEAERPDAAALLGQFRGFLRDNGWLDAARPVNQFD